MEDAVEQPETPDINKKREETDDEESRRGMLA
jgi:hypothetical protein